MFQNDIKIKISTGTSRKSLSWHAQELYWSEFVEQLKIPTRTEETFAEYMGLRKAQQDELKDVGGFVGGELKGEQRRNENAGNRYLVTLDADHIPAGGTQAVFNAVDALGCAYVIYSTRRRHQGSESSCRWMPPQHRTYTSQSRAGWQAT